MYLGKNKREIINNRLQNIEDMVAETAILNKRYLMKNLSDETLKLYDEKSTYIKICVEDIKNTITK